MNQDALMEKAIANVVRVDMITEGANPILMRTTTSEDAGLEPRVNEGSETPLRSKNRIIALNVTEDLVVGYTITLKEVTVDGYVFAVADGGTLTVHPNGTFSYVGPKTGAVVNRQKVTVDVWSEEKDGDGETLSYMRFRFPNAKGSPVKFTFKDGEFFAPEYVFKSRPKQGQYPIYFDSFWELPAEDMTAEELLALKPENTTNPEEETEP